MKRLIKAIVKTLFVVLLVVAVSIVAEIGTLLLGFSSEYILMPAVLILVTYVHYKEQ
jgi:hypothetical protein